MKSFRWHLLITLCLCILTFVITYFTMSRHHVEPAPANVMPSAHPTQARISPDEFIPGAETTREEVQALQQELEDLRNELARMKTEMANLENTALQKFLTTMAKRITDRDAAVVDAREATAKTTRRVDLRKNEMFGGMADSLLLLHDLSRMGDAGVDGLIEFSQNPDVPLEDRSSALEMLAYLPTKTSLDFLMQPHAELDYTGFTDRSDASILPHLERLPTADVEAHIPEIRETISESLRSGSSRRQVIGPLVALALIHNDDTSQQMLSQLRGNDGQVLEAVTSAGWLGTTEAFQYIGEIARTHPSANVREHAQELLDSKQTTGNNP